MEAEGAVAAIALVDIDDLAPLRWSLAGADVGKGIGHRYPNCFDRHCVGVIDRGMALHGGPNGVDAFWDGGCDGKGPVAIVNGFG